MPRMIVTMIPPGSLPGMMSFATAPTTRPNSTHRIALSIMGFPSQESARRERHAWMLPVLLSAERVPIGKAGRDVILKRNPFRNPNVAHGPGSRCYARPIGGANGLWFVVPPSGGLAYRLKAELRTTLPL